MFANSLLRGFGNMCVQVRILHETMKFPLWLHDRTVIRFAVVSTFPPKGVGKTIFNPHFFQVSFSFIILQLIILGGTKARASP